MCELQQAVTSEGIRVRQTVAAVLKFKVHSQNVLY